MAKNIDSYIKNKVSKYKVYSKNRQKNTREAPAGDMQYVRVVSSSSSTYNIITRATVVNEYYLNQENRIYLSEQKNTREAPAGDIQYVRVVSSSSSAYNIFNRADIVKKYHLDENKQLFKGNDIIYIFDKHFTEKNH